MPSKEETLETVNELVDDANKILGGKQGTLQTHASLIETLQCRVDENTLAAHSAQERIAALHAPFWGEFNTFAKKVENGREVFDYADPQYTFAWKRTCLSALKATAVITAGAGLGYAGAKVATSKGSDVNADGSPMEIDDAGEDY
jgi:hypothetical protein